MPFRKQILDQRGVDFAQHSISYLASESTLCRLLMPVIVVKNACCFVNTECTVDSLYDFKSGGKACADYFESGFEPIISELSAKAEALSIPTLLLVELYGTAEHPASERTEVFVRHENEILWRATFGRDSVLDIIRLLGRARSQDGIVGVLVEGAVAEQPLADQNLTSGALRDLVNTVVCVVVCAYDRETYLVCDAETASAKR